MVAFYEFALGFLKIEWKDGAVFSMTRTLQGGKSDCDSLSKAVFRNLDEYFSGRCKQFGFPFSLCGTVFQMAVWNVLREIPYGETISYKDLAKELAKRKVSSENCFRAAASACGKNPVLLAVPCHRVVSSSGIGGFSAGLETKKYLLALEKKFAF